jgi:hypothetical protein
MHCALARSVLGVFQVINPIVSIVAIAAIFLIGFQETAEDVASDVTEASIEIIKSVADARKDANETILKTNEGEADAIDSYASSDAEVQAKLAVARADAMNERARAAYDLAMATATGNYELAAKKCNALDRGTGRTACKNTADTMLATARADAAAMRDVALMAAESPE